MQLLRSSRWLLLALVFTLIPLSSHAQVVISVGFAPPALPVYEQPLPPSPDMMWTPGYWAWDPNQADYYWVPGAWVAAPRPGLLWTPGYWGWSGGRYFFHDGYWGPHIGYYGGVNYGFGYGGIGFGGGEWRGGHFFYNTAVIHVDHNDRRFGGYVFEDRARVDRGFVARDSRVAFSGGPGGIRHDPGPEERIAERDHHENKSPFQQSHEQAAHADRSSFSKSNGGHPAHAVAERPQGGQNHAVPAAHNTPASHPGG
ncbi:MAG: YXWGXW repeat-containing protein, partial [Terracidiphilus sp.]